MSDSGMGSLLSESFPGFAWDTIVVGSSTWAEEVTARQAEGRKDRVYVNQLVKNVNTCAFLIEPIDSTTRLGVSLTNLFGPNEGGLKNGARGEVSEGWLVDLVVFGENNLKAPYKKDTVFSLEELASFIEKHLPNGLDLVKY